jgi:hypothetical protein
MDGPQVDVRYAGPKHIQALALATLYALERAGMPDLIDDVSRRVLGRRDAPEVPAAATHESPGLAHSLIVELLLYEIKYVARAPHIRPEDRRLRIEWAMTMAGV